MLRVDYWLVRLQMPEASYLPATLTDKGALMAEPEMTFC